MWIVRLALRRPYTFVVLGILILGLGVLSILRSPVDIFPKVKIPVVAIVWSFTGFDAEQMSDRIVSTTERAFTLELARFERGLDPYVTLMLQQTALLAARQQLTTLQVEQLTATVSLVEALGGGWDRARLPPP